MKGKSYIIHTPTALGNAVKWLAGIDDSKLPLKLTLEKYEPTRNAEQNKKMWALLSDISKQVVLTRNGYQVVKNPDGWEKRSKEDWKSIMTAALKKQEIVPGIDGGFVAIGLSTSNMSKEDMSNLLTLIIAFGDQEGVKFKGDEIERI